MPESGYNKILKKSNLVPDQKRKNMNVVHSGVSGLKEELKV